ncbi:MAG: 4-hydroxy-tetrahydrodipicolinate reductase [Omnitrophica bacterium]|nr:4-hydroxy-tetrahydrodipicolinate reductase [Candidatus Omnitrophota bacterium]
MIRIVVSGALGRMGKRIIALAEKDPALKVIGRIEKEANRELGIAGGLNEIKSDYDCIIDFTTPKASLECAEAAKKLRKAIVIGTTGLALREIAHLREIGKTIPVVFSPNMSVGVNVLFNLIEITCATLGGGYKVGIKEAHHVHKKDKPSGTSKLMQDIVMQKMGKNNVPCESIREGEIIGDHDIVFESEVDTLKISHSAKTRDIFALGALKAAKFAAKKKNGFFSMQDVLGVKSGNKD